MSYTGQYSCPVKACDFTCDVESAQAQRGRADMLSHGYSVHDQDWNTYGNETFVSRPAPKSGS